jgi:aminoglycoside phosphotransferase (APT) family kinase protein
VAGAHSFGRGGPLTTYDEETRATAESLRDLVDLPAVLEVWDAALADPYRGEPMWTHGDLTATNLLIEDGRLVAVIDFGSCAIGDPACDLVMAWTFLEGEPREVFREVLALDPTAWTRARGWALWKALLTAAKPSSEQAALRRYGWRHHHALDLVRELVADYSRA